jgi:hypothetical protein
MLDVACGIDDSPDSVNVYWVIRSASESPLTNTCDLISVGFIVVQLVIDLPKGLGQFWCVNEVSKWLKMLIQLSNEPYSSSRIRGYTHKQ